MKQVSNNRRHNRSGQRAKTPNRNQVYDSTGPGGRIRGNLGQLIEKYTGFARDAVISGNPSLSENYYQHAEHYQRLLNLATEAQSQRHSQPRFDHKAERGPSERTDAPQERRGNGSSSEKPTPSPRRSEDKDEGVRRTLQPKRSRVARRPQTEQPKVLETVEEPKVQENAKEASAVAEVKKPRRKAVSKTSKVEAPTKDIQESAS